MITADETLLRIARAVAADVEIDRVDPSDYEHLAGTVEAMAVPPCAVALQTEIDVLRDMVRRHVTEINALRLERRELRTRLGCV